jgi:sporulation protein YlmC with PRC-barrel domain
MWMSRGEVVLMPQVILFLVTGRVAVEFLRRAGQPAVVGLPAGPILRPSLFGWLARNGFMSCFPTSASQPIEIRKRSPPNQRRLIAPARRKPAHRQRPGEAPASGSISAHPYRETKPILGGRRYCTGDPFDRRLILTSRIAPLVFAAALATPAIVFAQSQPSLPDRAPLNPVPSPTGKVSPPPSKETYVKATRTTRLIGATVYNDQNESVGSIDEVLLGNNHDIEGVVLSVGKFLGVDSRLVEVPANRVRVLAGKAVISNASKDQLKRLPDFRLKPATTS